MAAAAARHFAEYVRTELHTVLRELDETDFENLTEAGLKGIVFGIIIALYRHPRPANYPLAAVPVTVPRSEVSVRAINPAGKRGPTGKVTRYVDVEVELPGGVVVLLELKLVRSSDIVYATYGDNTHNDIYAEHRRWVLKNTSKWLRYTAHRTLADIEESYDRHAYPVPFTDFLRGLLRLDGYDSDGNLQRRTVDAFIRQKTRREQLVPYVDGRYEARTPRDGVKVVAGFTLAAFDSFACFLDEYVRADTDTDTDTDTIPAVDNMPTEFNAILLDIAGEKEQ